MRAVLFVPLNTTRLITPVVENLSDSSPGISTEEWEAEPYVDARWFTETETQTPVAYGHTLSANVVVCALPDVYPLSQGYHHGLPTQTQTFQVDVYAYVSAESPGGLPARDVTLTPATGYNIFDQGEISPGFENPGSLLRYAIHPGGPASLTMNPSAESSQVSDLYLSAEVCCCSNREWPWY